MGDSLSVLNSRNKRKFAIQSSELFQSFLTSEEQSLSEFKKVYRELIDSVPNLKKEEPNLFNTRYRIYEVATGI